MFKPTQNRVLVKPEDAKDRVTAGGIYITAKNEEGARRGIVIVGNGTFKEGQGVIFSRYSADEVTTEDGLLVIIKDDGILATYEND